MPVVILCLCAGTANAEAAERLPDVDVIAPYGLMKTTDGSGKSYVAFDSYVANLGEGPLKLLGQRANTSAPMKVKQVLLDEYSLQRGKVARTVPAGEMQFSPSASHNHWHYLHFQDYVLLSVPDLDVVAPTRKTGFCLVGLDRDNGCYGNRPEALEIGDPAEGVVGAGPFPNTHAMGMFADGNPEDETDPNLSSSDHYGPSVEGQDIEITNLPDGRYCLSFVVDPEGNLVEMSKANNGASRLIDVGTDAGGRTVAVGQAFDDSATCGLTAPVDEPPPPPETPGGGTGTGGGGPGVGGGSSTGTETAAGPSTGVGAGEGTGASGGAGVPPLTTRRASQLARSALEKRFVRPTSLSRRCTPGRTNIVSCRVAFLQGKARYSGTVVIKQKRSAGEWRWFYRIDVRRKRTTACAARARRSACPARVRTGTLTGGVLGANPVAARRVMALPPGGPAPTRAGVARGPSGLCRLARARIAAREPVG